MNIVTVIDENLVKAFGAQIAAEHRDLYDTDIEGAHFKIGQMVGISLASTNKFTTSIATSVVTSVAETDAGVFEYTVADVPFLLWESELVHVH